MREGVSACSSTRSERMIVNHEVVGSFPTLRAITGWQSSYAEDCKSSHVGAIPTPVSAEVA
jgi:hypothetical protein